MQTILRTSLAIAEQRDLLRSILILAALFVPQVQAIELKTAAQDSPPKYQQGNIAVEGIAVDIIEAIKKADPELKIDGYQKFIPFKRLQRDLEAGQLDVFFGLKRTAARDDKYTFIEEPIYRLNYSIGVRRDDRLLITSMEDLNRLAAENEVGTVRGAATRQFLLDNYEGQFVDTLPTPVHLVKVLQSGRIRFAFYHEMGLKNAIQSQNLESSLTVLPVSFSSYGHHIAFNRNVPQSTINRVEIALEKIRSDGTLTAIHRKYGLLTD